MELKRTDSYLKRCFVPHCKNNSSNTRKKFIRIPQEPELKKVWYEKVKRFKYNPLREYCCEEHFDLKNDADNYDDVFMNFKTDNVVLKKAILPHLKLEGKDSSKKSSKCTDKYVDEKRNANSMIIVHCDDYMNFEEYFAENDDTTSQLSSNSEDFTTDLLFSSDLPYSYNSLNLRSASEIDMGISKLYVPNKYKHYMSDYIH